MLVPRRGFEPRLPGPEPGVLPLDDLGICKNQRKFIIIDKNCKLWYHLSSICDRRRWIAEFKGRYFNAALPGFQVPVQDQQPPRYGPPRPGHQARTRSEHAQGVPRTPLHEQQEEGLVLFLSRLSHLAGQLGLHFSLEVEDWRLDKRKINDCFCDIDSGYMFKFRKSRVCIYFDN